MRCLGTEGRYCWSPAWHGEEWRGGGGWSRRRVHHYPAPRTQLLQGKQCWGSGSGCLFHPGIRDLGWVKNQDPDPEWTTRIIFPRAKKHFFGLKYLNSLMGSGIEKIRIRDGKHRIRYKHLGSVTLKINNWFLTMSRFIFRIYRTTETNDILLQLTTSCI